MAIRDERTGSTELLRDSRFHRAALLADPRTKDLAEPLQQVEAELRRRHELREQKEDERMETLAVLLRVDFELDEELKLVESTVLELVHKDRHDPRYVAAFPHGLAMVIALRGEEEARAVYALSQVLAQELPEVAARHQSELARLADASVAAEQAWQHSELEAIRALTAEIMGRRELVRQLRKNEAALHALFPGQDARVRSFFRPLRGETESGDPKVE